MPYYGTMFRAAVGFLLCSSFVFGQTSRGLRPADPPAVLYARVPEQPEVNGGGYVTRASAFVLTKGAKGWAGSDTVNNRSVLIVKITAGSDTWADGSPFHHYVVCYDGDLKNHYGADSGFAYAPFYYSRVGSGRPLIIREQP